MELLIKPHYKKDSFFIDTNKAFAESFGYDEAYNNMFKSNGNGEFTIKEIFLLPYVSHCNLNNQML